MNSRIIVGRAGSGKSELCLREIRERLRDKPDGTPLILLVPEQATFQAEQALVTTPGISGMIRAQVYNFSRLAWRVMQDTGGTAGIPIDETGKTMLLQRILHKHKERFHLFQHSVDQIGFAEEVLTLFSELKRQCITAETLQQQQERLIPLLEEQPGTLRHKLDDLLKVYIDYEQQLAEQYLDADAFLERMAAQLAECHWMKDADIWVDGFFGFTPLEQAVLVQCMLHCNSVTVTLCLNKPYDAGELPNELDLFYPTAITMVRLRERMNALGLPDPQIVRLEQDVSPRYAENPMLAHLERNYEHRLSAAKRAYTRQEVQAGLSLRAAVHRKAEVEGVARQMLRLAGDRHIRWRDMTVMVRDMDGYGDLLTTVFQQLGIPHFIDQKRPVLHHPLTEFIRSALEIIIRHWRYDAVFRCVKTDFFLPLDASEDNCVDRHAMDELENYVLSTGIQGSRWQDERAWQMRGRSALEEDSTTDDFRPDPEYVKRMERCRKRIVEPLTAFQQSFGQADNVRQMAEALYGLLLEVKAPERLERWSEDCIQSGNPEKAREHSQVWERIVDLLDQLVEMLGDESVGRELFAEMVDSGLDSIRMGLVPPSLDQVLIGTIDRTRSTRVKYCFVLGVNDGVLPAKINLDGILSENERELMREAGVKLADGGRRKQLDEQLLIYSVLCTPSEHLWLSYPLADEEGRALLPSETIKQIQAMFPTVEEKLLLAEPDASLSIEEQMQFITPPGQAVSYLFVRMKQWMKGEEMADFWWEVYNWLQKRPEWRDKLDMMVKALDYSNRESSLSVQSSRLLYGGQLKASVSRMERFVSCPFSQFASHGLRLAERRVYRLEAPDIGQLFHAALSGLIGSLQQEQADWAMLSREQLQDRASAIVDRLAPRLQSEILLSSPRYRYIARKLKGVIGKASYILAEHAKRSGFVPVGLELGFGPGETLPPLTFQLSNGCTMEIVGRIDRVDRAESERGLLLRVIDYKSSQTSLQLAELYYGLSLQMLTYLDVVLSHSERWLGRQAQPAGVLYFHVHNPLIRTKHPISPEEAEAEVRKQFKMKGLVLADEEAVRLMDKELKSGHSQWIPVALKTDGSFYSSASVATPEQWDRLRGYVRRKIRGIGTEITEGNVSITPFRLGGKSACTFCPYKPVCQFDPLLEGNEFRILERKSSTDIWTRLGEEQAIDMMGIGGEAADEPGTGAR
ncbi:helicase-exonuclease AddAB subunit AddB [Paenibacillus sp. J2TS4]|uniref:helicase-exonuclease AddAB subunit AddB n=1 Tax=Paenibacillus sp. J2TS4 TaxID=2807194 RepID=UPI001B2D2242|nr:helicase-exonuclease AddAB subunit AddB [Paenibacillus sp. J2TS4]GIP35844.1 ATP-dependent helicase/deoxyribonuclease subunit B [Paenibacillus sp. J2TS4]